MSLDDFKAALASQATEIQSISGDDKGLNIILINKRKFTAKRQRIKDCANDAELQSYVQEVLK